MHYRKEIRGERTRERIAFLLRAEAAMLPQNDDTFLLAMHNLASCDVSNALPFDEFMTLMLDQMAIEGYVFDADTNTFRKIFTREKAKYEVEVGV